MMPWQKPCPTEPSWRTICSAWFHTFCRNHERFHHDSRLSAILRVRCFNGRRSRRQQPRFPYLLGAASQRPSRLRPNRNLGIAVKINSKSVPHDTAASAAQPLMYESGRGVAEDDAQAVKFSGGAKRSHKCVFAYRASAVVHDKQIRARHRDAEWPA